MKPINAMKINEMIEKRINEIIEKREIIELINCQKKGMNVNEVHTLIEEIKADVNEVEGYELTSQQAIIILEKKLSASEKKLQ